MKQGSVVNRYLPFLAIAALQLVLVATQPASGNGGAGGFQAGQGPGQVAGQFTGGSFGGEFSPGVGGAPGSPVAVGGATAVAGQPAAQAGQAAGGAAAAAGASAAGQPLDAMGRPLDGDTSKCAEGGLLQQTVTRLSTPCIPQFVGDNGGATSQGVTKDEIIGVYFQPRPNPELDAVLATQGLAVSPEKNEEILDLLTQFMNKHYELYGRKFKWIQHLGSCSGDPNCPQIEAKAILEKYKPFVVSYWIAGASSAPEAFVDEIARAGVIALGAPVARTDEWYAQRQTVYQLWSSGTFAVDAVAGYYCAKMSGKNATLAGDPVIRTQTRKLGIITPETPDYQASAERLKALVSGGRCGSPANGTTIYTLSTDSAQAEEQQQVLITRMSNDGITTVHNIAGGLACSANCDQQNYFPENFFGSPGPFDHDTVHRLLQTSKTQAANTFGIGYFGDDPPLQDQDHARAIRDIAPNYGEVPQVTLGVFHGLDLITKLVQMAGPHLTPGTIRAAADTFPQINGWVNANAWPGWECCDADTWMLRFGPGRYTGIGDNRHIFWDNAKVSRADQKPGSWACPDGCKRFTPDQWTPGEPKQA